MTSLLSLQGARSLRPLWPHQERTIEALRRSMASGHRRIMVQMPTGAGKTLLAAHIIRRALDKRKRVAFTVPFLNLIEQTIDRFEVEGIDAIGVMQGRHERTDSGAPVQICSVQTLARRGRPAVDFVVVDEAHQLNRALFQWFKDCPDLPFIGLSATPYSRGLGRYYSDLIATVMTSDLIESGHLAPFAAFAPATPNLKDVKVVAGEFHEGELADAMDRSAIIGDIVKEWITRGENRPTFAFCVNRKHAQHVAESFLEAGVRAAYMDGETSLGERHAIFAGFRAGEIRIVCNVEVLTTGVDEDVRCIIDAKPTKSPTLFVQTIGRGLRTAEGKDKLLILDHAGNHLRLGQVTDQGIDRLDDGKQRRSDSGERKGRPKPLPKLCEDCKAIVPPRATSCPQCGAQMRAWTRIEAVDGELVELGKKATGGGAATIADNAAFFGELRGYALERGYAAGWCAHKFREKFKVWPNEPRVSAAAAREPSLATRSWIKSRNIAWAKRSAAHG